MSKRAAAAAQTRQRIVDAALDLHGSQGIAATRWEDIASRAGVGVGTVYRHFPSLDELIPACGEVALALLDLPAPSLFEGVQDPADRIEMLVREAFAIYERGAPALRAIRRESDVHPRVAEDRSAFETALGALVDAALSVVEVGPADRAVARAMVDLSVWEAARGQGLGQAEAVAEVAGMLTTRLLGASGRMRDY